MVQLEKSELEVKALNEKQGASCLKINSLIERYKKLTEFCFEGFKETRDFLDEVKNEQLKFNDNLNKELVKNKDNFERLTEDILLYLAGKDEEVSKCNSTISTLKEKLELKKEKLINSQKELSELKEIMNKNEKKNVELLEQKNSEIKKLESNYNQYLLESEVEMENLKYDFTNKLTGKDNEIKDLTKLIKLEQESKISEKKKLEDISNEEKLKWDVEKKIEIDILRKEFEESYKKQAEKLKEESQEEMKRKLNNEILAMETENKLKKALYMSKLEALSEQVMCFQEDLQTNDLGDITMSSNSEFFTFGPSSLNDLKAQISDTNQSQSTISTPRNAYITLEASVEGDDVVKHVVSLERFMKGLRLHLTSLLDRLFSFRDQIATKVEYSLFLFLFSN